jgi:elongator complex protein 2
VFTNRSQHENHRGIFALLKGHTDVVNAIRFITPACLGEALIISGSVDKTIRIWQKSPEDECAWSLVTNFEAHASSINCIADLSAQNIFVTGAADATVKVWQICRRANDLSALTVKLLHTVEIAPKFFPLALAIATLDSPSKHDSKEFVLAVAGTRASIQIYVAKRDVDAGTNFSLIATLTGHEAWIRSLAITHETVDDPSSDFLIASASQDKYIRLWRIHRGPDLPKSSGALSDPTLGILARASLSNKAHRFATATQQFSVTFEALLLGHEDWIYTAFWRRFNDRLQLLSASADNSLAVWEADKETGIWSSITRLGEISAQKGSTSATGSTGGFWLGLWSPDATAVISLGRTGGWRLWQRDNSADSDRWTQKPAVTGHTREVNGIAWSRDGSYVLSTSKDQTTRLHAEWKTNGQTSWHEFSRPQIHGYDLNCIDTISDTQFISGADEKLLRVFDEPDGVADILHNICNIAKPTNTSLPDAANIPVLGLSNKAVFSTANAEAISTDDNDVASIQKSSLQLTEPPLEDHLARHLLWPELEKLYGHGYEINCVTASHDGTLVATACKASSIDHAVIRLYDTKEWREIKPVLKGHSLTVTGLKFSVDDQFLLSVGRDRQFCLWERSQENGIEYILKHSEEKAHSRMILVADWAPLAAGTIFATGGRDKSIKIWQMDDANVKCVQTISADVPVTALAFLPELVNGKAMLAYGLESGDVKLCAITVHSAFEVGAFEKQEVLQQSKTIAQVLWRPRHTVAGTDRHGGESVARQLAIASTDSSLHIASITLS